MAIKFRTLKKRKLVNRCIICGKIIPPNKILCTKHDIIKKIMKRK